MCIKFQVNQRYRNRRRKSFHWQINPPADQPLSTSDHTEPPFSTSGQVGCRISPFVRAQSSAIDIRDSFCKFSGGHMHALSASFTLNQGSVTASYSTKPNQIKQYIPVSNGSLVLNGDEEQTAPTVAVSSRIRPLFKPDESFRSKGQSGVGSRRGGYAFCFGFVLESFEMDSEA